MIQRAAIFLQSWRSERRFAFGVMALALAVRLLPATIHFVVGADEAAYLTLAQNLAAGRGFTLDGARPHTEFDPGYPLAASLIYGLGSGLEFPAQINLILGGLVVLPIYLLARELYDQHAARRAALLTALLPALVLGVPNFGASSEQVYTVCVWLGLLALWHGLRIAYSVSAMQHPIRTMLASFALAGLSFGYAHLTRWEGMIYLCVGAMWIGWRLLRGSGRGHTLIGLLTFILAFALLAMPYGLYLQRAQGTWFSSKGSTQQLQGEAVVSSDPLAWEREYEAYEQARDKPSTVTEWATRLWANRDAEIQLYLRNWLKQFILPFQSVSFLALLWMPFVLLAWIRWRRAPEAFAYLLTALAPLGLFPVAFVDPRYWLPLIPGLLIWAAAGLVSAEEWLKNKRPRLSARWNGFALSGGLCLAFIAADMLGAFLVPAPVEYKALGEWMSTNGVGQGAGVMARKRQTPFYAGAKWEWLPLTDTAGLLAYAAERGAQYVVIDERTVPSLRPQLEFLLNPANAPASLKAIRVEGFSKKVVLYEIVGPP